MKLLDEIIALATNNDAPVTALLRKAMVLAYSLKNERLKVWLDKELNGFGPDDELPAYRVAYPVSKGHFLGPFGASLENLPLPTSVLKAEHRHFVEKIELRGPIAAYLPDASSKRSTSQWVMPWPTNLTAAYQNAFTTEGLALVKAWQELPTSFMDALVDTVRNRLLIFALELGAELDPSSDDVTTLPPEKVDRTVINIIYGGSNVIAGSVGEVAQAETLTINKGDLGTLSKALERLGIAEAEVKALDAAIAEDAFAPAAKSFGEKTREWIAGAALKLASNAGDAGLEVAKAQMTAELTKLVAKFLGMT